MSIRVVLADDHRIVREGLRLVLESDPNIQVVGEAGDGRTALEMVQRLAPDVVVMDIAMPDLNGVEATRQIVSLLPQAKVVALTTHADRHYVLAMLEAGASGYVIKSNAGDELLRAVAAVRRGQKYVSADIAGVVVEAAAGRQVEPAAAPAAALGPREREVLQLLAEGRTSKEIAAHLHISVNTVEAHRRNIMDKLDLHSIAQLTKYAIREGLTSLDH